jgi:hypothetical protein
LATVIVAVPLVPGVMTGVATEIDSSATRGPAVTADDAVLFNAAGSTVGDVDEAEPSMNDVVGTVAAGMKSATLIVALVPGANGPANVHDNGPAGNVPVQPTGSAEISTPTGGEYDTVIGPAAFDGPAFDTVITALPVSPGVIEGVDTNVDTSADGANAVTIDGTVLFSATGSAVGELAPAEPPDNEPAGVEAGTDNNTPIVALVPGANGPANVHDNGPAGNVPVQPTGSAEISTPTGGEYDTVIGPAAFDGPAFDTVITALPVSPGVIEGVDTNADTSADAGPTSTEGTEALLVGTGSTVDDDASADPSASNVPGTALTERASGTVMMTDAEGVSGPLTMHDNGPAGNVPVQPLGRAVMATPVGGEYDTVIGPAAFDGPAFDTVITALPVSPGAIVGFATVVATSAEPAPIDTVTGPALLVVVGSETVDVTEAEPVKVARGVALAGTESSTGKLNGTPGWTGPVTVHDSGPAGMGPVQFEGRLTMATPTGGVKVTVAEGALEGPTFDTLTVAVTVVPGVIDGTTVTMLRSAEAAPTVADEGAESLVLFGSVFGVATPAVPPVSVVPGVAFAGIDNTTGIVATAPAAMGPAMVHVRGPEGRAPMQLAGIDTMDTPVGGL